MRRAGRVASKCGFDVRKASLDDVRREFEMFGQLLSARLKAAEKASRNGRLDEAYRLASSSDLAAHRRGAAVLAALVGRFVERARDHFREDRCAEALLDLDRAERCGGTGEQIAELRRNVKAVARELERQAVSRHARIDEARARIERGSLAAGRRILQKAGADDAEADGVRRDIEQRGVEADALASEAEMLIKQGQLAAAGERLRKGKGIDARNARLAGIEAKLCKQVLDAARAAVLQARFQRARDELACLGSLGASLPEKGEVQDLLATIDDALTAVQTHRYTEARQHVLRLARVAPGAKWAKETAAQLERIATTLTALHAGPLGERMKGRPGQSEPEPKRPVAPDARRVASLEDTVPLVRPALGPGSASPSALPDRLLLLVNGGGSYLLLRNANVSVGRAACDKPADIPLFADIAEREANITRVDDDYFLFSSKQVEVAGGKTKHTLLRHRDRVVLGRKAKLSFRIPSRRSATAVLELSDTTKMPQDVRRAILFDRHATIGVGPTAHIVCRHATPALVLFERSGSLWIRQKNDGHVDATPTELKLGEPVEIGGVGLVLQPWRLRLPGTPTV